MSPKVLVVGAILVDQLRDPRLVLAARRLAPRALAGRWEFPGGKVFPGEDPVEALRRELIEELDLVVRVGTELSCPYAGCWPISETYEMRVWFVESVSGSTLPGDSHDELRWVAPKNLKTLDWLEADGAIVDALIDWFAEPPTALR